MSFFVSQNSCGGLVYFSPCFDHSPMANSPHLMVQFPCVVLATANFIFAHQVRRFDRFLAETGVPL